MKHLSFYMKTLQGMLLGLSLCFMHVPFTAQAVAIQEVRAANGVTAWLVESNALPMISVQVSFVAGSYFDPPEKGGLARLTATLMDEGAGGRDRVAYQKALEDIGAYMSASATLTELSVSLTTLSENKRQAFSLLRDALSFPRFEEEAVARMAAVLTTAVKRGEEDPNTVLSKAYMRLMFENHPYANPVMGTVESLKNLRRSDVKAFQEKYLTRRNMVISVVGDISAHELKRELQRLTQSMPVGSGRQVMSRKAAPYHPQKVSLPWQAPQSVLFMGHRSITREDPDFVASFIVNYVLGGGGFTSRLTEEVREKRGLAYSVGSSITPLPMHGAFLMSAQTKNEAADETMQLMVSVLEELVAKGMTEQEYQDAMTYLSGSFPMRLDSNGKILAHLTMMQREGLAKDYLDEWVARLQAVTLEDVNAALPRLLHPHQLSFLRIGG